MLDLEYILYLTNADTRAGKIVPANKVKSPCPT